MEKLGVNVISTSKDGFSREVVFIQKGKGSTRKDEPRLASTTFHQWKISGDWYPPKPL